MDHASNHLGSMARSDRLNQLISNLRLSATHCPRGTVLLFSRVSERSAKHGDHVFDYLHIPATDRAAHTVIDGIHGNRLRSASPESALMVLQDILLKHFGAGTDLHDRFTCLIAAAICILVQRNQWGLSAQRRPKTGGLAVWQEDRAKSYLEGHLSEPLAVDEVAQLCGISTTHFSRLFKISTGHPPYRWLLKKRMQRAKALLSTSPATIAAVATECGFTEQSHFTRTFRQEAGMTPGAWRQVHRRK
jgi:AraC-like DNA-binding protein